MNPLEEFIQESYSQTRALSKKQGSKIKGYTTEFIYEIVKE